MNHIEGISQSNKIRLEFHHFVTLYVSLNAAKKATPFPRLFQLAYPLCMYYPPCHRLSLSLSLYLACSHFSSCCCFCWTQLEQLTSPRCSQPICHLIKLLRRFICCMPSVSNPTRRSAFYGTSLLKLPLATTSL